MTASVLNECIAVCVCICDFYCMCVVCMVCVGMDGVLFTVEHFYWSIFVIVIEYRPLARSVAIGYATDLPVVVARFCRCDVYIMKSNTYPV